jgi:hypothetical protein
MATLPGGVSFNPAGQNEEDDQFGPGSSQFEQAVQLLSLSLPTGFAGPQGGTVGPGLRALLQLPRNRSFVRGFGRPRFGGTIPQNLSARISGATRAGGQGFGVGPVARPQPVAPAPAPRQTGRARAAAQAPRGLTQGPRLQAALAGPQRNEILTRSQRTVAGAEPARRAANLRNQQQVAARVSAPGGVGFTQPLSTAGRHNFIQSRDAARAANRAGNPNRPAPRITGGFGRARAAAGGGVSDEFRRFFGQ